MPDEGRVGRPKWLSEARPSFRPGSRPRVRLSPDAHVMKSGGRFPGHRRADSCEVCSDAVARGLEPRRRRAGVRRRGVEDAPRAVGTSFLARPTETRWHGCKTCFYRGELGGRRAAARAAEEAWHGPAFRLACRIRCANRNLPTDALEFSTRDRLCSSPTTWNASWYSCPSTCRWLLRPTWRSRQSAGRLRRRCQAIPATARRAQVGTSNGRWRGEAAPRPAHRSRAGTIATSGHRP